jgi:ammonium transporter, Amt family
MIRRMLCGAGALGASMLAATAAFAQEAVELVEEAPRSIPATPLG